MITRIEVDGFKSLRDFTVDLEPFTVFIGPNSAGKSNILEALALLSRVAGQPVGEAFKGGRGRTIDQFSRIGPEAAKSMKFAVEFLEHGIIPRPAEFQSRFRYELTIERRETKRSVEQLVIQSERLVAMGQEHDHWIRNHPEFADRAGYSQAGADYFSALKSRATWFTAFVDLHKLGDDTILPFGALVNFRRLHVDSVRLGESSERLNAGGLAPDASNLPTVLAEMSDSVLGAVRANLVALVPGIASFDVVADNDDFRIEFQLSGGGRLPARLVSDGTLRILALLAALHSDSRPSILGIEEPENGVFPGRLRALLDLLRRIPHERADMDVQAALEEVQLNAVTTIVKNFLPTQILLTTHSPVVLSTMLSEPKSLRFIDMVRRNGERVTRARKVGPVASPGDGRFVISPHEIEAILDAVHGEAAE